MEIQSWFVPCNLPQGEIALFSLNTTKGLYCNMADIDTMVIVVRAGSHTSVCWLLSLGSQSQKTHDDPLITLDSSHPLSHSFVSMNFCLPITSPPPQRMLWIDRGGYEIYPWKSGVSLTWLQSDSVKKTYFFVWHGEPFWYAEKSSMQVLCSHINKHIYLISIVY